jgi:DNA-binding response OmpR family regulator
MALNKILVVDDDQAVRSFLCEALNTMKTMSGWCFS